MPTFLVGFKCPPQHGGEAQHRFAAIGELACDVLMGESSPLYARLYSQGLINGSFGAALRELNAFESIAVSMAEGRFQGYDPYRFPEIYDDITAEDVRAFLRENFTRAHMALSVIAPKEG